LGALAGSRLRPQPVRLGKPAVAPELSGHVTTEGSWIHYVQVKAARATRGPPA
jgi:hypothetical protein